MNNFVEDESKSWKWGILYFNKKDSRIFIPKKIGLGWSINFARPAAVLWLAGLMLLAIILKKI
jgi:uncharacterized membrane protein